MEVDQKLVKPGDPVISLGGLEWFMPVLAMRQSRVIVPKLMRLLPVLQSLENDDAQIAALDEGTIDELIAIAHPALTRAYPTLTIDQFIDLPVTVNEICAAAFLALKQTEWFRAQAAGEAKGETAPK